MKKINLLSFLFLVLAITSCSSGDEDNNNSFTAYFNHSVNNQSISITQWTAIKGENDIEVLGTNPDGSSIFVSFNKFGNVDDISITSAFTSSEPWMNSYYNFSSNYINFELVSLDENNKRVKVNYSGKVYEDQFDISSDFKTIEGSFHINYIQTTPQIPGLQFMAKIGGQDWHSVKSISSSTGAGFSDISLQHASDDAYVLSLNFNHNTTNVGVYNYTASSSTNNVVLYKYKTSTHEYIEYSCVGTLNLTEKSNQGLYNLLEGTFSFTATNPEDNSQIQVTNGTFKDVYIY